MFLIFIMSRDLIKNSIIICLLFFHGFYFEFSCKSPLRTLNDVSSYWEEATNQYSGVLTSLFLIFALFFILSLLTFFSFYLIPFQLLFYHFRSWIQTSTTSREAWKYFDQIPKEQPENFPALGSRFNNIHQWLVVFINHHFMIKL